MANATIQVDLKNMDVYRYVLERLAAAEEFIDAHPCDPDITDKQTDAYRKWMDLKAQEAKYLEYDE